MRKHLRIVADDFGYGLARNQGIVKCFQGHAISAVSILANCKYSYDAVKLIKSHNIPAGLHFNITEGRPLSSLNSVSSLLNPDGKFMGKSGFWENSCLISSQVATELNSQISWFENMLGYSPLHVDGHQHVQVHPRVAECFAKTLAKREVRYTRLPIEHSYSKCSVTNSLPMPRMSFHKKVGKFALEAQKIFQKHKIHHADVFIGMNFMGSFMTTARLQSCIRQLFNSSVSSCELMVHPGYQCDATTDGFLGVEFADTFSCSPDREQELNTLLSKDMIDFYEAENIRIQI